MGRLLQLLIEKPEVISIAVNALTFLIYLVRGGEPFKILYWGGATILVAGLLGMKG